VQARQETEDALPCDVPVFEELISFHWQGREASPDCPSNFSAVKLWEFHPDCTLPSSGAKALLPRSRKTYISSCST